MHAQRRQLDALTPMRFRAIALGGNLALQLHNRLFLALVGIAQITLGFEDDARESQRQHLAQKAGHVKPAVEHRGFRHDPGLARAP
jgi:hypothetical protein